MAGPSGPTWCTRGRLSNEGRTCPPRRDVYALQMVCLFRLSPKAAMNPGVVSGDVAKLALEVGVMLHIRLTRQAFALAFQPPHAQIQVLHGEHLLGIVLDVTHGA